MKKKYSRPVSLKVWGGKIEEEFVSFSTWSGNYDISYNEVEAIFVGRIRESFDKNSVSSDSTGQAVLKSMPLIGRIARERSSQVVERQNYLIALIFTRNRPAPFRLDSLGTNFRQLLGEDSTFAGEINLCRFIKKIAEKTPTAFLSESTKIFFKQGRGKLKRYDNLNSFIEKSWVEKEDWEGDSEQNYS